MNASLAVFFVYVWPEPQSSAAGVRTRELIDVLLESGWRVAAVSPSGESPHAAALRARGVAIHTCDPNHSPASDPALQSLAPALVVYDRFVMEEQFGWRARALWPEAFHVVDTQDLHALRRARERLVQANASPERVLNPTPEDMGEDLLRELASLYRADAALVVSSFELALLRGWGYGAATHLPFSAAADAPPAPFAARAGFAFLGNFRHPPNLDSVRFTLREIWPRTRAALPHAELHLYGAYPPAEISAHKGKHGVHAHGPVTDHRAALRSHRALLAPLRFGAGIKGKVLEAWGTGTPVVGTALTFEGMGHGKGKDPVEDLVRLEEQAARENAQAAGLSHVAREYSREKIAGDFLQFIEAGRTGLMPARAQNLVGQMLRHHSVNSTKYFSRWIEGKRKIAAPGQ